MNYGIITEQGDLGLGFDEVSETEADKIKKSLNEGEGDIQHTWNGDEGSPE